MKKRVNIGLCGLGTVGSGVCKLFEENSSLTQKRSGLDIRIVKAITIDPIDNLGLDFSRISVSDRKEHILDDPDIDIVVELIGGTTVAKDITLEALAKGKSVVTANKALIAEHSAEIFKAAYQSDGFFAYEAAVGGGIPIIRTIKDGFSGDRIEEVSGILNGTCNYILSSMTHEKTGFSQALKEAQEKGFAEADPSLDVNGDDTAHKLLILMELAFNRLFDYNQLYVEGITNIEAADIKAALEMGYRIKLMGKAARSEKGFEGRVHPVLVKSDSLLALVEKQFNAVSVRGDFVGDALSYGAGAGSRPTASAVVSDIIETSRLLAASQPRPASSLGVEEIDPLQNDIIPIDEIEAKFYLRFAVNDPKSAITEIVDELRKNNIDITLSVELEATENETVSYIAALTEKTVEKNIQASLKKINDLPCVIKPAFLIRADS